MANEVDDRPLQRTLKVGGFALTVNVPGSTAKVLRQFKPKNHRPFQGGGLEFLSPLPTLHVQKHDIEVAANSWASDDNMAYQESSKESLRKGDDIQQQVADHFWYHTIELPGGVVTPGAYDHRTLVPHYGIPVDLSGQRVLDVATFDGFWAFEFEKRGAEVTALDIPNFSELDHPAGVGELRREHDLNVTTGQGFRLAAKLLDSKVNRIESNVYDITPERLGQFDLVHMGDLLLHLRDPLLALQKVRSVTKGRAMIVDSISGPASSAGPHVTEYKGGWDNSMWWLPSMDTLAQMVLDAGFSSVKLHSVYRIDLQFTVGPWRAAFIAEA